MIPEFLKIVLAWGQSAYKNCQCGLATVFCCFAFGTNHCQLGKAVEGRLLTSDRGTFGGTQDLNYLGVGQQVLVDLLALLHSGESDFLISKVDLSVILATALCAN